MVGYWQAFSKNWFEKHQAIIVALANTPMLDRWFRKKLDLKPKLGLEKLTPNAAHYRLNGSECVAVVYSFPKYAQTIYEAFKSLWWLLHYWDEFIADRYIPALSYGFDTLTDYAQAFSNNIDFDGLISSAATNYFDARNGNGSLTVAIGFSLNIDALLTTESSRYASNDFLVSRGFIKFDFTSIPTAILVQQAVLYLALTTRTNTGGFNLQVHNFDVPDQINYFSNNPQAVWASSNLTTSSTSVVFNTTSFASFNLVSPPDYTALTLNSTGRTYLATKGGGYPGLVLRHSRDVSGGTPSTTNQSNSASFAASEYFTTIAGVWTGLGPFIEITYVRAILPSGFEVSAYFGQPTLSQGNPNVTPPGFVVSALFGLPILSGQSQIIRPTGFTPSIIVGTPQIPIIQTIPAIFQVYFGFPLIPIIQAIGFPVTATFSEPAVTRGRVIQLAAFSPTFTFGLPDVGPRDWTVSPTGIVLTATFGIPKLTSPYPDGSLYNGPYISVLVDQPISYASKLFEFEDGTSTSNVHVTGAKRWELSYDGITQAEVEQITKHFNSMRGTTTSFDFYHRRDGVIYDNVRYLSATINNRLRAWNNSMTVILEKRQ